MYVAESKLTSGDLSFSLINLPRRLEMGGGSEQGALDHTSIYIAYVKNLTQAVLHL